MSEPLTPLQVVKHLGELTGQLDRLVQFLKDADLDAAKKRHAADLAEAHAFLGAEGSVEARRRRAEIDCERVEAEALVAEALVRNLKAQIRAIELRIDVGRSYGTTIRAEFAALGYQAGS